MCEGSLQSQACPRGRGQSHEGTAQQGDGCPFHQPSRGAQLHHEAKASALNLP